MPQAFLFDIGNVIIAFDFSKAAARLEPYCKMEACEALEIVSGLTPALETGHISPDEFIAEASTMIGYSGSPEFFREAFEDIFVLNEPMVRFIEQQKAAGKDLFLLSNTNGIHVPFFEATYPVFDLFDGRIYSHEVGVMKPDPDIYTISIEKLRLNPNCTIYVDDVRQNCEAGEKAGFFTIWYQPSDHASFLESASRYL
tara:strand:+ start:2772 stop:3368 length:597 start_codon:yes stop_codon:yes gene_type:complete